MTEFTGQQPDEAALEAATRLGRRAWLRAIDALRVIFTVKSALIAVGGVGASVLAVLSLGALAGIACAAVTVGASVWAVFAGRLLIRERASARWAAIGVLRHEQRAVRAEAALDVVTLALAGDRTAMGRLHRIGRPDLVRALRARDHALRQAAAGSTSARPSRADARAAAPPPAPDTKKVRRHLSEREAELKAIEARIQAYADPTDDAAIRRAEAFRAQAKAAHDAALKADREARDRRRRGLPATVPPGREVGLELEITPAGVRSVRRSAARPTPEQLAAGNEEASGKK